MKMFSNNQAIKGFVFFTFFSFGTLSAFAQQNAKTILDRLLTNPEYKKECVVITQMRNKKVDDKKILNYLEKNYSRPHKRPVSLNNNNKTVNPGLSSTLCIGDELGVETGNFGTWQGAVSAWSTDPAKCPVIPWTTATLPIAGRIAIVPTASPTSDPCADVLGSPILLPSPTGGKYSIQLGNNNINSESERIIHSFMVQPGDTNFTYQFAIVLEDGGHLPSEQPFFDIVILDKNNDTISCSYKHYVVGSSVPGFIRSSLSNSNCNNLSNPPAATYYMPWTTTSVNLSAYVGQAVTIVCTTAGCSRCGHMGYAYVDFTCNNFAPITYCAGTNSVSLTAPPETAATYSWSTGATTNTVTVNPQIDDTVSVNITVPNGCGYKINYALQQIQIIPGFSFTKVCNNYLFTDTSKIIGGNINKWHWDFGDGDTSGLQNVAHTYTMAGTYTVSLIVTSQLGCADTALSIPIIIVPPPLANAGPNVSVCLGTPTTLNASGTPPGGNFVWTTDPSLSSLIIPNPIANPIATTTYSLTYTDPNGCTNFDAVIVSIYTPVSPNVGPPLTICDGGSTTLSVSGGSGYVWSPSTSLNNDTIADPIASPTATTNYTVSATDLHSCVTNATEAVTVMSTPVINVGANQTVCMGQAVHLNAISNPPGVNFAWIPSTNISNPSISNPTFTPLGPGMYTFTVNVTTANGCSSAAPISILVNPLPSLTTSNPGTICPGSSVTLDATSPSAIAYTWTPSSTLSNPIISNPVATPPGPGTYVYVVTVTDANGCVQSAISTLNIAPQPIAAATYTTVLTCEGANYKFTNASVDATSWKWNFGDGSGSTLENPPVHIFDYSGTHTVTLIVANDVCADTLITPVTVGDLNSMVSVKTTNIFTPNQDGDNDCFQPIVSSTNSADVAVLSQCMTLQIFDRWGIEIYNAKGGPEICWDGKTKNNIKANEGIYYYIISLGKNSFKGYVTLIRKRVP